MALSRTSQTGLNKAAEVSDTSVLCHNLIDDFRGQALI